MKVIYALIISLLSLTFVLGQNEQAPIVEKDVVYKNWTYKSIHDESSIGLRDFARGKKLVMVVYFAPWCSNWRFDAPLLQRLHEKYRSAGLGIIAVGEYDPVTTMKASVAALKVTFPVVYESQSRADSQKTLHYEYRKATGDGRNWGSPWYIFLNTARMEKAGETLVGRSFVINGEIIEGEGEHFIRHQLGLPPLLDKAER